ncbi:MAG: hypothetical protein EBX69_11475 [Betaproteobacteria bacterium]|nr:hypothetical protein [Betaproteobacteria bacterium]
MNKGELIEIIAQEADLSKYNTGHGHLGWTLGAITAVHLTQLLIDWQRQSLQRCFPVAGTGAASGRSANFDTDAREAVQSATP